MVCGRLHRTLSGGGHLRTQVRSGSANGRLEGSQSRRGQERVDGGLQRLRPGRRLRPTKCETEL
jgi:hypothetical protein